MGRCSQGLLKCPRYPHKTSVLSPSSRKPSSPAGSHSLHILRSSPALCTPSPQALAALSCQNPCTFANWYFRSCSTTITEPACLSVCPLSSRGGYVDTAVTLSPQHYPLLIAFGGTAMDHDPELSDQSASCSPLGRGREQEGNPWDPEQGERVGAGEVVPPLC